MKDVRIVIVSWNVEKFLRQCLLSLNAACDGLDWDCVVVDNASLDGSVDAVRKIAEQESRISVIASNENLGFGKASNLGARGAHSQYVLFLNPDTECPPHSLSRFIRIADEHPRTAILGPKLTYPDGRVQASVRRFPDVWSQAGILLKLHHLLPDLRVFRSYFAKDLDLEKAQTVDQVMGACFLVRREFIELTHGFDERFFIWFEEVDWCRRAHQKKWEVRYVPLVSVIHHGGESFGKVFSVKKQRYFNESLIAYSQKWHTGWQTLLLRVLAQVALVESWILGALKGTVAPWIVLVLALETVSALTIFHPIPNSIATFVLGITMILLAWKKPVTGLGILLLELLIGSKGQILQFGYWPVTTSLRIIMTGGFLLGWSISVLQKDRFKDVFRLFRGRKQYAILYLLIGYAILRGIDLGNGTLVIRDANAWFDWILLLPVLDVATRYRASIRKSLIPVFFVGIMWLALKTIGLEYIFSHGIKSLSQNAYLWVRRTGVGEVTLVVANAFRIFEQSYVYATTSAIIALAYLSSEKKCHPESDEGSSNKKISPVGRDDTFRRLAWSVLASSVFILGISLSRSFWIGTAAGCVVLVILLATSHELRATSFLKRLWSPLSASVAGLLMIGVILAFPLPPVQMASLVDLFGSRTDTSEAAAASRWNLMPVLWNKIVQHPLLGSGFGATVTYQTKDPRILAQNPGGMYTTYAFEWGWFEHWIKFGILGIPMILWLFLSLGRRLWKTDEPLWFRAGAVSSLVALAALHFFTPYLNHPLGFLYFFVGEAIIITSYELRTRAHKSV